MSNMSYCRFENTVSDLRDCFENFDLHNQDLSESELNAREEMIDICVDIALDYGMEIDREVVESD